MCHFSRGKSQYTQYATRLTNLLKHLDTKLKRLGFETGDLGSHSCHNGVSTMIAAGCRAYTPIVALCIWVVWVLGEVKDKYLFRDKSGDHYVGRCASGLDQLETEFAVSPPYFDFTELCEIEKLDRKRQINQFLETLLPRYTSISAKNNHLKMCCFATFCFHHNKLKAMLQEKCPLHASPIFRDIPSDIMLLARI